MMKTKKQAYVLGLKNKSAGFSKESDNLPPNELEIIKKIQEILNY